MSSLFKQIIIKFQSQDLGKQQGVLLWLKTLLSLHWVTIVKRADKEDLQSLGQIQSFIQKKTKSLDKVLLLKGKLDMLSKTIEFNKSLAGVQQKVESTTLVYKDAEDEDEDMASKESSDDEVIEEIDVKHAKRPKRD